MAIILVPTDAADMLTAVGMANPTDIIRLEVGLFQGANNRNITPAGLDPLTIEGETGDPVDIVVDAQVSGRAFVIQNAETATTILKDLTMVNGRSPASWGGGGIFMNWCSPTLTNLIVHDCSCPNASFHGGGIYGRHYTGTISNSIIHSCSLDALGTTSVGGGIAIGDEIAVLSNLLLFDNVANGNNDGAGIGLVGGVAVGITANNLTVVNNNGTGIESLQPAAAVNIKDSIIRGNVGVDLQANVTGVFNLDYCDYNTVGAGTYNATNCINADPLLVAGGLGNHYLSQIAAGEGADSPCVDAGSDTAANLGMDTYTTRTDNVFDEGQVDIGYHYADAGAPPTPSDNRSKLYHDRLRRHRFDLSKRTGG